MFKRLYMSQLVMRGNVKAVEGLGSYNLHGMVIFGDDCFNRDAMNNYVNFAKKRCLYGNAEIVFDINDVRKSVLRGYFNNLEMRHIADIFLGIDLTVIIDHVSLNLLNMQFFDMELTYSIVNQKLDFNFNAPAGVTLKGKLSSENVL